jgi:hypothetical protein
VLSELKEHYEGASVGSTASNAFILIVSDGSFVRACCLDKTAVQLLLLLLCIDLRALYQLNYMIVKAHVLWTFRSSIELHTLTVAHLTGHTGIPEQTEWVHQMLEYNVKGGKVST